MDWYWVLYGAMITLQGQTFARHEIELVYSRFTFYSY